MRKKAKYILATLLMFCVATSVKAEECSYDKQVELNNIAATVKATYEETEIDTGYTVHPVDPETGEIDPNKEIPAMETGFIVKILNITDDIYVRVVKNEDSYEEYDEYGDLVTEESDEYYYYTDTDKGTLVLETVNAEEVHNYEIYVYASDSKCDSKELRKMSFKTPMYNHFYSLAICSENPEFEYCQEYITNPYNITLTDFMNRYDEYVKNNEKNDKKENKSNISKFFEKNKKMIIIAGSILIIVGVATTAIIVIKRRSRLI